MDHGKPEAMYESAGLNSGGIVNAVIAALGSSAGAKRDGRA
jgi:1-deoxy-D-xylulose-5-phosphate synthase